MTYKQIVCDPESGLYSGINKEIFVLVDENHVIHSPHGISINDDEEFMKVVEENN